AQTERLAARREQLQMQLEEAREPAEDQRMEMEALPEGRAQDEEDLGVARQALAQVDQQTREQERRRSLAEQQAQVLRTLLDDRRLLTRDMQTRRQGLQEQLLEAGYDLRTVLTTLPEGATEADWELQLARLDAQIQRLGAINLAAIEERSEEHTS